MTKILIGATIPAFKMTDNGHWHHWLENAAAITSHAQAADLDVRWLATLQHDARGRDPFQPLLDRISTLERDMILTSIVTCWFSVDTGEERVSSASRLGAICTGRNLIIDHALRYGYDWIYFADADIQAPDDILPRLLELDWPVCGANVPTYCLNGPAAADATYLEYRHSSRMRRAGRQGDVRVHWNTAGSLLVHSDVFRRVPWRYDPAAGETDDPATQHEMARLGWPTLVRHDIACQHHPAAIGPLEQREHDLTVYR